MHPKAQTKAPSNESALNLPLQYSFAVVAVVIAVVAVVAVVACPFVCHPVGICFCPCSCLSLPVLSQPTKQTSSRPKAAHFAAAVERSLYFAFVLAFVAPLVVA